MKWFFATLIFGICQFANANPEQLPASDPDVGNDVRSVIFNLNNEDPGDCAGDVTRCLVLDVAAGPDPWPPVPDHLYKIEVVSYCWDVRHEQCYTGA